MKRKRKPKHTIEFIREYFKKADCELLSKVYLGSKQKLKYKCKCGSIRHICFNNFSRSTTMCSRCYGKKFEIAAIERLKRIEFRHKLYTIQEAVIYLGVSYEDFYRELTVNMRIPLPTHRIGNKLRLYYEKKDLNKIRKLLV